MAKLFCEYNSLNGHAKNHISKLPAIHADPHHSRLGRTCGAVLFFPSLRLVTLGIFCSRHHGAHRHCAADCVFFEPAFSKRPSSRIKCHCAAGGMGGRVFCHARMAAIGTSRYLVRYPRPRHRFDCHRILYSIALKIQLETAKHPQ